MRFFYKSTAVWADCQNPIHMRRITAHTIAKGRIAFACPRLGIAGIHDGQLCRVLVTPEMVLQNLGERNVPDAAKPIIGQRVDTHKPCAFTLQPRFNHLGIRHDIPTGQSRGGSPPLYPLIGTNDGNAVGAKTHLIPHRLAQHVQRNKDQKDREIALELFGIQFMGQGNPKWCGHKCH